MNAGEIAFPHLGIFLSNVPKTFSVFGLTIAFYGLLVGTGIILGILCAAWNCQKAYKTDSDLIWDFALYAVFFSVVGARLYYVIFAWEYYKDNLFSIFNIKQGGLAIYGGVIGAFLTLFIYCKIKKIDARRLGDICMPALILGQAIGRWGNFMNREVFGEYTDNFLAMRLPVSDVRTRDISASILEHMEPGQTYIQVHPTFLYESLWNFALFLLILLVQKHKKFEGEMCLLYLGGYGLGRFWIEGIRTDTLFIPGTTLPVSQVLAAVLFIFSVGLDVMIRIKKARVDTNTSQTTNTSAK